MNNNNTNENNHPSLSPFIIPIDIKLQNANIYRVNMTDGSIYTGTFRSSLKDGYGRIDYTNGTFYEGEFKNDLMNGRGKLTLENDLIYEGTFKNSLRDGEGMLKSNKINYLYIGQWRGGFKQGFGKYI